MSSSRPGFCGRQRGARSPAFQKPLEPPEPQPPPRLGLCVSSPTVLFGQSFSALAPLRAGCWGHSDPVYGWTWMSGAVASRGRPLHEAGPGSSPGWSRPGRLPGGGAGLAGAVPVVSSRHSPASPSSLLPLPSAPFPPYYLQTGILQAWERCPCTRSPWWGRTACPRPSTSCGSTARWGARSRRHCPRTRRPCSTW